MSECLFCKIVSRTIPAALVYEDDVVVSFDDINPACFLFISMFWAGAISLGLLASAFSPR